MRGGPAHHKILFGAKVHPGAQIKDAAGHATGKLVTDGDVDIEADTPTVKLGHTTLVYTWGHGKHGGEASGYLALSDFAHPHEVARELRAKQKHDHQPGDHPRHRAPHHVAVWHVEPVAVPDDIFINRPSQPGVREELRTFAPGDRLDLCHNVPNQPGGGGVIMPLLQGMKFYQVRGSVSQPVYKQRHPRDKGHQAGFAHWIKGFVEAGSNHEVLEGWVLLHVDGSPAQLHKAASRAARR